MASECGVRPAWIIAALLMATAIIAAGYLITLGTPPGQPTTVPPAAVTASGSTPTAAMSPASNHVQPAGLQTAVGAFLAAWSTTDPIERRVALTQTATDTLTEQLALTDPEEVPPSCTPSGPVQVVDRTPGAVLVTLPTTCEGTVWIGLQADPASSSGWRVNAVGRQRSWIQ